MNLKKIVAFLLAVQMILVAAASCGKNEPDGNIVTSGWYLYYVDNDGNIQEFGYADDEIDGAWEFFKEKMEVEF